MPANGPCPSCGGQLVQVERSGVRIDACRQCRGVWLDRGELDKIIERSAPAQAAQPAPEPRYQEPRYQEPRYHDRRSEHGYRKHKRESWLGEIFDF